MISTDKHLGEGGSCIFNDKKEIGTGKYTQPIWQPDTCICAYQHQLVNKL